MKHIISIGIDKANGLTPLGAAVSGAKEFALWGQSQGYRTDVFVDETNRITQSDIFDRISEIVDSKTCEQLIVFFSGHGILKSPSQEIWLLSNARNNPNESINLTGSIDNARTSGIPYIVFISDACRVLPNELQFTGNGSVIFPIIDYTDQDCAIDIFYATRPGNPALEQNSQVNSKKFGLFTQALLEILNGEYPELIKANPTGDDLVTYYSVNDLLINRNYKSLSNGNWHITSINSESSIKSVVANKAREISIILKQNPDIRIQYQNPKPGLAEFTDNSAKDILLSSKSLIKEKVSVEKTIMQGVQDKLEIGLSQFETNNKSFKSILQDMNEIKMDVYNTKSTLIQNSEVIFDSKGKSSFETQTGFTIIGTTIKDVLTISGKDIFTENNKIHIRIYPHLNSNTALIILNNGNSIPVAIIEGYIGTLVFKKNQLLTINYTPSRNSHKYHYFEQNENRIGFVRSFVASAANEGFDYSQTFKNEFTKDGHMNYSNAGSYLRQEKSIDPSLGLYAVYAFRQEGKIKDIKSVYSFMAEENENIIFDVAMLANSLSREKQRVAPFCPMIAIGWAYRNLFDDFLSPEIREASNFLSPSLWSTFDKKGTEIIRNIFV
jgi:hypothetical protein